MNKENLAYLISWIFSGIGMIFWLIPWIIFILPGGSNDKVYLLLFNLCFLILPTSIYLFIQKRRGKIKSYELNRKEERYGLLAFSIVGLRLVILTCKIKGLPPIYVDLLNVLMIESLVFLMITFFWKISIHALLVTNLILFWNLFSNFFFWWFFIFIPLVFWARIRLKRHTFGQVFVATSLVFIIFAIFYYFFGFFRF